MSNVTKCYQMLKNINFRKSLTGTSLFCPMFLILASEIEIQKIQGLQTRFTFIVLLNAIVGFKIMSTNPFEKVHFCKTSFKIQPFFPN